MEWAQLQRCSRGGAGRTHDVLVCLSTPDNSSFVDDNGVVDLIHRIASALHQSVVSACILYGFPGTDRRE